MKTSQKVAVTQENSDSTNDLELLNNIADHALSVASLNQQYVRIVDCGATSHMCYDKKLFTALCQLEDPINIILGHG